MPELTPDQLKAILDKLDAVCEEARALQRQIKTKMAEDKRRDYPAPAIERRKPVRKSRR